MAKVGVVDLKCSNCGAALDAPADAREIVCRYCGRRMQLVPDTPPPPAPPPYTPRPSLPPPAAPSSNRIWGVLSSLLLTLGIAGFSGWRVFRSQHPSGGSSISLESIASLGERSLWDSVGGPPRAVALGGHDAAIGRMRIGSDDQLYYVAVDGQRAQLLWKSGPYGSYSDGYRATSLALAGERAAISDFRAQLHVVSLATGKTERTVALTDKVESLCGLADGRVWLRQIDRRSILIDLATGAITEGKRPAECPAESSRFGHERRDHAPPRVAGFRARSVLVDGTDAVAVGAKEPGTAVPMAVGFDPHGGAVRWKSILVAVDAATVREPSGENAADALAAGRLVTAYGAGSKQWHLVGLDAASGDKQWDVTLRPLLAVDSLEGIALSKQRVYLARTSSLDVYDAATGKLVGTVGNEAYE